MICLLLQEWTSDLGPKSKSFTTNYLALGHTNEAVTAQPFGQCTSDVCNTRQTQSLLIAVSPDSAVYAKRVTIDDIADAGAAAASTIGRCAFYDHLRRQWFVASRRCHVMGPPDLDSRSCHWYGYHCQVSTTPPLTCKV
jgi:hypothetical protein